MAQIGREEWAGAAWEERFRLPACRGSLDQVEKKRDLSEMLMSTFSDKRLKDG